MGCYVDDAGCNTNSRPETEQTLVSWATHNAQLWNDILWSSGGALEHSKCSYHYLKTDFTDTGRPFFRGGQFGGPIIIRDATGNTTLLTQLSAYMPSKTLGTYQAATHCQRTQYDVLKKKASNLTRILSLRHCTAHAAWLYFKAIFQKSVGYPLSVSRLSSSQLYSLQGPMISVVLNRMHYSSCIFPSFRTWSSQIWRLRIRFVRDNTRSRKNHTDDSTCSHTRTAS